MKYDMKYDIMKLNKKLRLSTESSIFNDSIWQLILAYKKVQYVKFCFYKKILFIKHIEFCIIVYGGVIDESEGI